MQWASLCFKMGQSVLKDDPQLLFVRIQLLSFQESFGGAKFVIVMQN